MSTPQTDYETIPVDDFSESMSNARFMNALHPYLLDEESIQVMAVSGSVAMFGHFNNKTSAMDAALHYDRETQPNRVGVSINRATGKEASNSLDKSSPAIRGDDVARISNIMIDIDANHPKGFCSSDEEHEATQEHAQAVCRYLSRFYWPEPIIMDTGNGTTLLYPADLPVLEGKEYVEQLLKHLGENVPAGELVKLDTSACRLSETIRVPGTINRRHEATEGRPQREVTILSCPEIGVEGRLPVKIENIQEVVGELVITPQKSHREKQVATREQLRFIRDYANACGFHKIELIENGIKCCCPFHDDKNPSLMFTVGKNGGDDANFTCLSNSCMKSGSIKGLHQQMLLILDSALYKEASRVFSEAFGVLWWVHVDKEEEESIFPTVRQMSLREMMTIELPPHQPLIQEVLDEKEMMLISGLTGLGKSTLSLQLVLSLASGTSFLGMYPTGRPRKVLVFQGENIWRRNYEHLSAIINSNQRYQCALDNIHFPSNTGEMGLTEARLISSKGHNTDVIDWFKNQIKSWEADIVLFDPLEAYHNCREKENDEMKEVMKLLKSVCNKYGATPIVIHHERKPGGKDDVGGIHSVRGAGTIVGNCEVVLRLERRNQASKIIWEKVRGYRTHEGTEVKLELCNSGFRLLDTVIQPEHLRTIIEEAGGSVVGVDIPTGIMPLLTGEVGARYNGGVSVSVREANELLRKAEDAGHISVVQSRGRTPKTFFIDGL